MKKNRRMILAAAAVAVAAALASIVLIGQRAPPEPVYQGKTLGQWLSMWGPVQRSMTAQDSRECSTALHQMGTNAVPFLVRMLQTPDSSWKAKLVNIVRKQHFFAVHYVSPDDIRKRGEMGLYMLGPKAEAAVPELIKMFESNPPPFPRGNLANLLGQIGPGAKAAVPCLLSAVNGTNDWERSFAIQALGQIHSEPGIVVPVLITRLSDKSRTVQGASVKALGDFESNAKAAVPALIKYLESASQLPSGTGGWSSVSSYQLGMESLEKIDPEAAAKFATNNNSTAK